MRLTPTARGWLALAFMCAGLSVLSIVSVLLQDRPVGAAPAAIDVDTTVDDTAANGNCTLREAIRAANSDSAVDGCPAGSGADTIVLPTGVYSFTLAGVDEDAALTGDLDILDDLTISGALSATTVIDAASADRVIDIHSGHVVLRDLTVRRGRLFSSNDDEELANSTGAGILARSAAPTSSLELVDSAVTDNVITSDHGEVWVWGGGISSAAPLTVSGSLITGNGASQGGGISSGSSLVMVGSECRSNYGINGGCMAALGRLIISDSLIADNSTYGGPPTTYEGGGIYASGNIQISGSTISGHEYGGGIVVGGSAWISDTLVVNNTDTDDWGGGIINYGRLRLSGSTIAGNQSLDYRYVSQGGGIYNSGELIVFTSLISGNTADMGGGLFNVGRAELADSAIVSNAAVIDTDGGEERVGQGGGAYNSGAMMLTNVTVSGNTAQGHGGGLANAATSQMILRNSTVTGNLAARAQTEWLSAGDDGGVYAGAPVSVTNTLIAGNAAPTGVRPDAGGTLLSGGYNLIGDSAGVTLTGDTAGNLLNVAALLGPLEDHGGAALTHALLPDSPAIDAASPLAPGSADGACAPADQRGVARPLDGDGDGAAICDIGAVEALAVPVPLRRVYLPRITR